MKKTILLTFLTLAFSFAGSVSTLAQVDVSSGAIKGTITDQNKAVVVGALVTAKSIDRGTVEPTIVEEGAKIDSHCHVAHNCRIGAHALLIGYARMGGSVSIGKHAILAQNAAVGEGLTVGDGAVLATSCEAYYEDVPGGATMLGAPARPFMQQKRIDLITGALPEMHRELRDLRKRLEALEALGSVMS